jgi:hypothetical protein
MNNATVRKSIAKKGKNAPEVLLELNISGLHGGTNGVRGDHPLLSTPLHLLLLPKFRLDDKVQISTESISGPSAEVMIS